MQKCNKCGGPPAVKLGEIWLCQNCGAAVGILVPLQPPAPQVAQGMSMCQLCGGPKKPFGLPVCNTCIQQIQAAVNPPPGQAGYVQFQKAEAGTGKLLEDDRARRALEIKQSIGCFQQMIADTVGAPTEWNVCRLYVLRHALAQAVGDISLIRGRPQQAVFDEYVTRGIESIENLAIGKEQLPG